MIKHERAPLHITAAIYRCQPDQPQRDGFEAVHARVEQRRSLCLVLTTGCGQPTLVPLSGGGSGRDSLQRHVGIFQWGDLRFHASAQPRPEVLPTKIEPGPMTSQLSPVKYLVRHV